MENALEKVELKNLLDSRIEKKEGFENYSYEERNLFSEVWNSIAFQLGIRESLVPEELKIIFDFMQKHFKLFSLNDLREAFSYYSAQKLNFKDSHFQSLDNVFIGKVLSSYKEFIANELRRKPKQIENSKIKELTFEEIKFEAEESFKDFKENKNLDNYNWIFIYNYYKSEGKIKFEGNEAKQFQEVVKSEIIKEVDNEKMQGKKATATLLLLQIKTLFYGECKKRAVLKYYKSLL
jgi:hypothetical protein